MIGVGPAAPAAAAAKYWSWLMRKGAAAGPAAPPAAAGFAPGGNPLPIPARAENKMRTLTEIRRNGRFFSNEIAQDPT